MATSPKERFDAAVKVIHSLPKDGPFQPSYDMMLTFYGLYKQATEGKCTKPKPWSWDIVSKKKWDAWSKHGEMPIDEAMDLYVDELKKSIDKSTDKWKTMGDKEKRIVETMPQEKPVTDFMETIGTFYELIDEKSPFEDEMKSYNRMNGSANRVLPADEVLQNGGDMNHSLMVDPILKNVVKQDARMNGIANGLDNELDNNNQTDSALSLLDSERENWDRISNLKHSADEDNNSENDSEHNEEEQTESDDNEIHVHHDNLKHPVNGDIENGQLTSEKKVTSKDRLTNDSDSDDEFCDTSDQPSPENISRTSKEQQVSTPLNGNDNRYGNKQKNRVHFSDNPSLRTDVTQPTLSPIPQRLQQPHDFSVSPNFPFGLNFSQNSPHESMIVHGPSENSLNVTGFSELGDNISNSTSSSQSDNFINNEGLLERHINSDTQRTRGGGQVSPPGGSSSGNVAGQMSYHAQGYRHDQGYGQYGGLPPNRGQGSGRDGGRDPNYPIYTQGSVNEQIAVTLLRLQQDMHTVLQRLDSLESVSRLKARNEQENSIWNSKWWPLPGLTGKTFLFVVIWPIIVHWLFMRRRRER